MCQPSGVTIGLLDQLGSGDEGARSALIAHSYDRLQIIARRILGEDFYRLRRWEQTDDVLQNALLRLNSALESCTPSSSDHFWNLAARLVRRELIDLTRHHFGPEGDAANHHTDRGGKSGLNEPVASPSKGGEPSSLVEWAEFLEMTEILPDEEREIFDLLWVQEMTEQRVAEVLGVSVRTVRRRWRHVRLRLARWLKTNATS